MAYRLYASLECVVLGAPGTGEEDEEGAVEEAGSKGEIWQAAFFSLEILGLNGAEMQLQGLRGDLKQLYESTENKDLLETHSVETKRSSSVGRGSSGDGDRRHVA